MNPPALAIRRINWFHYASPQTFLPLAGALIPRFGWAAAAFCVAGLYIGFFVAPTDQQQGEAYRIIFIHVPAAWMSMFIYLVMALWAGVGLAFNTRLSGMMASALAPTGALFTVVALWTGSMWGKPTWGTWWVWDGRLTSMLVLFFLYLGYIALANASSEKGDTSRVAAVFGIIGAVNIPIINRSVIWWESQHQKASITLGGSSIDSAYLIPLLVSVLGFSLLFAAIVLMRMRAALAEMRIEARMRRMAEA